MEVSHTTSTESLPARNKIGCSIPSAQSSTDSLGGIFDSIFQKSTDSLGGMQLPLPSPIPESPANAAGLRLAGSETPILHVDHGHFAFIKNYLPVDEDGTPGVRPPLPHGIKHKLSTSFDQLPAFGRPSALSPIPGEGTDHCDKRQRRVPWTHTEDMTILALNRHHGTQWDLIASQLPGRTADAVRNRCFRLQRQHPMSTSEEGRAALDGFVLATHGVLPPSVPEAVLQSSGPVDADLGEGGVASTEAAGGVAVGGVGAGPPPPTIPTAGSGTCVKGADHGRQAWSTGEDLIIEDGVARLGCKWREIAKFLNGRSDSSIRNRWMRLQKDKFTARSEGSVQPIGCAPADCAAASSRTASLHSTQIAPTSLAPMPAGGIPPAGAGSSSCCTLPVSTAQQPPQFITGQPAGLSDPRTAEHIPAAQHLGGSVPAFGSTPLSMPLGVVMPLNVNVNAATAAPAVYAAGEPIPLGHDSPGMLVDLDRFAALAFEAAAEPAAREAFESLAAAQAAVDANPPGPEGLSAPLVKLASAFLATFAALSLARGRGAPR